MTPILSLITDALDNGLNLDKLLIAVGMDKATFTDRAENNEFLYAEQKIIRAVISEWERMEDLR